MKLPGIREVGGKLYNAAGKLVNDMGQLINNGGWPIDSQGHVIGDFTAGDGGYGIPAGGLGNQVLDNTPLGGLAKNTAPGHVLGNATSGVSGGKVTSQVLPGLWHGGQKHPSGKAPSGTSGAVQPGQAAIDTSGDGSGGPAWAPNQQNPENPYAGGGVHPTSPGGAGGAGGAGGPTSDPFVNDLMAKYPKFGSILDRNPDGSVKGLGDPYRINAQGDTTTGEGYRSALTDMDVNAKQAFGEGPSPYAIAQNKNQDLLTSNAMDMNQRTGQANEGAAEGNLAMRGGLQSGARERLSRDSMRDTLLGGQGIQNAGNLAKAQIGIGDEKNKADTRLAMPGQYLAADKYNTDLTNTNRQYGTGVDEFNAVNAIGGMNTDNTNNLGAYNAYAGAVGAGKTADALAGTGGGGGADPMHAFTTSVTDPLGHILTGSSLTDPSNNTGNRQAPPPKANPYAMDVVKSVHDPRVQEPGGGAPAFMTDVSSVGAADPNFESYDTFSAAYGADGSGLGGFKAPARPRQASGLPAEQQWYGGNSASTPTRTYDPTKGF